MSIEKLSRCRLSLRQVCGDAERCFENEGEDSDGGWGCSGGEGLALLNVRRLGQVVAFGPSK
jgi:hypothetical protein